MTLRAAIRRARKAVEALSRVRVYPRARMNGGAWWRC